MSIDYQTVVVEDLEIGHGTVSRINPQGGLQTGNKIGLHSWGRGYLVDDFGAVGDGVTNDYVAIQNAINQAKSDNRPIELRPGAVYLVGTTLWCGRTTASGNDLHGIIGHGATILGAISGQPVIDWTGAHGPERFMHGVIVRGDSVVRPNVGILLARNNDSGPPSSGLAYCEDISVRGSFTVSSVYNVQSENNSWVNCYFENNAGPSTFILTRTNPRGVTSPNVTLGPNTTVVKQEFYSCTFNNLRNPSVAGDSALEIDDWSSLTIVGNQFNSDAGDISLVRVIQTTLNPSNISFLRNLFHANYNIGIEFAPSVLGIFKFFEILGNTWGGTGGTTANIRMTTSGSRIRSSKIEIANKLIASASNSSFDDNCSIFVAPGGATSGQEVNISAIFEGTIIGPSDMTLTLSGTAAQKRGSVFFWDTGQRITLGESFIVFGAADATPSVLRANRFRTGGVVTITDFTNGVPGQEIFIICDHTVTFDFTGTNLKGNAGVDYTAKVGDSLRCIFGGTNWYCHIGKNVA